MKPQKNATLDDVAAFAQAWANFRGWFQFMQFALDDLYMIANKIDPAFHSRMIVQALLQQMKQNDALIDRLQRHAIKQGLLNIEQENQ